MQYTVMILRLGATDDGTVELTIMIAQPEGANSQLPNASRSSAMTVLVSCTVPQLHTDDMEEPSCPGTTN